MRQSSSGDGKGFVGPSTSLKNSGIKYACLQRPAPVSNSLLIFTRTTTNTNTDFGVSVFLRTQHKSKVKIDDVFSHLFSLNIS